MFYEKMILDKLILPPATSGFAPQVEVIKKRLSRSGLTLKKSFIEKVYIYESG